MNCDKGCGDCGVGNGSTTYEKHNILNPLFKGHINIVNSLKYPVNEYVYIDANAGCGYNSDDFGSATIFLNNAVKCPSMKFYCVFIEKNRYIFRRLDWNTKHIFAPAGTRIEIDTCQMDNAQYFKDSKFSTNQYGLIFCDPNGYDVPYKELTPLLKNTKIDIVIFLYTYALYRATGVDKKKENFAPKIQGLKDLIKYGKKDWYMREIGAIDNIWGYKKNGTKRIWYRKRPGKILLFGTNYTTSNNKIQKLVEGLGFSRLKNNELPFYFFYTPGKDYPVRETGKTIAGWKVMIPE